MAKTKLTKQKRSVNVSVSKRRDGKEEVISGVPINTSSMHPQPQSGGLIGMAKGVTKNMGDYESLRVDVWMSVPCDSSDPEIVKDLYDEIESTIDDVLETVVEEYL